MKSYATRSTSGIRKGFSIFFRILAALGLVFSLYLIFSGNFRQPVQTFLLGTQNFKRLREPLLFTLLFYVASYLVLGWKTGSEQLKQRIVSFSEKKSAIWWLFGIYGVLFVWQQINAYLSLEIHYLPFEYYNSMMHFMTHGKFYYTGCLHAFYHIETLTVLLYPIWLIFKSPVFFMVLHGLALSFACVPLYYWARLQFRESFVSLAIAFAFLNYKFLIHGLEMNFTPAGFYPLTVFATLLFAYQRKWVPLTLALLLGLLLKEDGPFYFFALGVYLLFFRGLRKQGALVASLSVFIYLILIYVVGPMTGAQDRYDDTVDIYAVGTTSFGGTLTYFATHPWHVVQEFFYPWVKTKSLFSFFSKLLFLPLFSFSLITTIAPLGTILLTRQEQWMTLGYQYALHIVPFGFMAATLGLRNLSERFSHYRQVILYVASAGLVLLNIGNYSTLPVTANDLKTLKLAKSIPYDGSVLTMGHLLPYVGYRDSNCYLSPVLETGHADAFEQAKYVLIAREVNTWSPGPEYIDQKLDFYLKNPNYEAIVNDGVRYLFKRK